MERARWLKWKGNEQGARPPGFTIEDCSGKGMNVDCKGRGHPAGYIAERRGRAVPVRNRQRIGR